MILGYDTEYKTAIYCDYMRTGHICIVGSTGSGKSIATLYILYNILKTYNAVIYIGDFKKTGDYKGITTEDKFAEYSDVVDLIERFYEDFLNTEENSPILKILLLDEYAGLILWLMQTDKKKADEIKAKIASLLMLSRSKSMFCICVQQRITAQLFPTGIGAIDNFQICIGMGKLSTDSRKSLFAGQHIENTMFEENYTPKMGQGLILVDGKELRPFSIPYIKDKKLLKRVLGKYSRSI